MRSCLILIIFAAAWTTSAFVLRSAPGSVRLQQVGESSVGRLHAEHEAAPSAEKDAAASLVEARLIVTGQSVQGPYYRTIVKNEAAMMRKLKGSLYERDDGKSTELIVQGSKARVASFIKWVEKGPPLALRDPVSLSSVQYRDVTMGLTEFEIKKIRSP